MKLIFGANGKLGTDFKELLDSIGEKYIASDKDEIDITNGDFLRAYVQTMHQNYKIDTIINCAAYNYVDRAETEKELCYKLNAEAPATLANIAAEIGANVELAKRGGLLHDIGKVLVNEIETSHAIVGGEFIKRFGEKFLRILYN